jgi:hypothetical protein
MIGPDAPNQPERTEVEAPDYSQQASPGSEERTEAPAEATFGPSGEPTPSAVPSPNDPPQAASEPSGETAPPRQETSTATVAPATASPTPVRKAPRLETPRSERPGCRRGLAR